MVPILLYGSENWIMTESLKKKLREVGKKNSQMAKTTLKYNCHSYSQVVNNEMSDFTMKAGFSKILLRDDAVGVGVEVLHACVDDTESVKECVKLEEWKVSVSS